MNGGFYERKLHLAEKIPLHIPNCLVFLLVKLIKGAFGLNFQVSTTDQSLNTMFGKGIIFGYTSHKKLNWYNSILPFNLELVA